MSTWFDRAVAMIAEIDKKQPANATPQERMKAVQAEAWRFNGGTSWGQKIWPKAKRSYFAAYYPAKSQAAIPPMHLSPLERMMARAKDA